MLLTSDSAFLFHIAELETAARLNLPLVCVVGVDHQWGLEVGVYKRTFEQPSPQPGVHWSKDVRFDKIAEGFGCHGEYVEKEDDIGPAIERAYASGKTGVVHVCIDPKANSEEMPKYDEIQDLVRRRHSVEKDLGKGRAMREYLKFYIDGKWVDPVEPKTLDVDNPTTEQVSGKISLGSAADVDKAVKAAATGVRDLVAEQPGRAAGPAAGDPCRIPEARRRPRRRGDRGDGRADLARHRAPRSPSVSVTWRTPSTCSRTSPSRSSTARR